MTTALGVLQCGDMFYRLQYWPMPQQPLHFIAVYSLESWTSPWTLSILLPARFRHVGGYLSPSMCRAISDL
jgi:hypothetical protein